MKLYFVFSFALNKEEAVCLPVGRKEVYIFHPLTNILTTQIDMLGMISIQRRKDEHPLGKINCNN